MRERIMHVLAAWGIGSVTGLVPYETGGGRIVYRFAEAGGRFILKGYPVSFEEASITSNARALAYLGNQKKMAPALRLLPDGGMMFCDEMYRYMLMKYVEGRDMEETEADWKLLGTAAAILHGLTDYPHPSPIDTIEDIRQMRGMYKKRPWKTAFDGILDAMPDFAAGRQCFIHSDIGSANVRINKRGEVVFVDLDDAGMGSQWMDIGTPIISQFVKFDKKTKAIDYQTDLAAAYLAGYASVCPLSAAEYDLAWHGAAFTHMYNMQWFGDDAADDLWEILQFGMAQKECVRHRVAW